MNNTTRNFSTVIKQNSNLNRSLYAKKKTNNLISTANTNMNAGNIKLTPINQSKNLFQVIILFYFNRFNF